MLLSLLGTGCGNMSFLITPVPAPRALEEQVIMREARLARSKIALIDVDGVLENRRDRSLTGLIGENPVAFFKEKLDRAARDKRVVAVVVRINSPGGSVTASDLMYTELARFRESSGKPAIASMMDVAASGGYYLACAADRIFAHPTTVTGSIGVIMLLPEFTGTMEMLGVRMRTFKSGDMKDAGSIFREMDPEERALFQNLIMQMYQRFLTVVERGRANVPPERLAGLADGRVFLAPDAADLGLIDEVGTLRDAIRAAKEAAGLGDKPVLVVRYTRPLQHRPNIYATAPAMPAQVNVLNLDLPRWFQGPAPEFMYLWAPGW
jgi:protease-4